MKNILFIILLTLFFQGCASVHCPSCLNGDNIEHDFIIKNILAGDLDKNEFTMKETDNSYNFSRM